MIPLGVLASAYVAPAGGTFSPADIAGLDLWLDGASLSSLAESDPIASWADSSGAGNTATQATGANRPVYSTSAGFPAAYFNGYSNHYLATNASASGAAQTAFFVATVSDDAVRTPLGASATTAFCIDLATNRRPRARTWGNISEIILDGVYAPPLDTIFAVGATFDDATDTIKASMNSRADKVSTNASATLSAGRTIRIGIKSTNAERHYGHIFEVLHYSAFLSDADRSDVMAYLVAKYSIV